MEVQERPVIERNVLDCIHHYIILQDEEFNRLQNGFADKELRRLTNIAHLGLVSKVRPLARHNKLEHAYGTYWLCKQCAESCHGIVTDKKEFLLAGMMHGIGHLPFSYDTEYAVAKLYQSHEATRAWLDGIFDQCADFAQNPHVKQAADNMKSQMNYLMLHRWFASFKMAKSNANEFKNQTGKNMVRILVDPESLEHELLQELDRIDYVLRDMHYLAFGRLELNISPILAQFRKGPDGKLYRPDVLKLIDVTHDWLCDQVYLGPKEKCLAQVMEKSILREVMDGHLKVEDLLFMTDHEFEEKLSQFHSGQLRLDAIRQKIDEGKLTEVTRIACDSRDKTAIEVEKDIAQTNISGIHKYSQTKGIYVQCTPIPYQIEPPPYEGIESGVLSCVAYDMTFGHPESVVIALARAEAWAPNNLYGIHASCREKCLQFILGRQVQPRFDRYEHNNVYDAIRKCLPGDRWGANLFNESWELHEDAVEHLFYEYDFDWPPIKYFIQFPERWNLRMVKRVYNEVNRIYESTRRHRNESENDYQDRKDRLLEYSTYLKTVLRIEKDAMAGWVVPSVWILKDNGEPEAEVDIIACYAPSPSGHPATLELIEVSSNDSQENEAKNRQKLKKITQDVKERFDRRVRVIGSFNGRQIIP